MIRSVQLLAIEVRTEEDVVLARQRARQLALLLGYDLQGQTRIGTAVSEIVRNAFRYASSCRVSFSFIQFPPRHLLITVTDAGPGITNLEEILAGRYVSNTGMGMGLLGTRRIMDRVEIVSAPGQGTTVTMLKFLPIRAAPLGSSDFAHIAGVLAHGIPGDPLGEVRQQNQELLSVLSELNQRQADLVAVNKELEDTNRGVVALYAELDARTEFLRKTTEIKGRFLSNMTHEFRTPLNSIVALANMLLDRTDGHLAEEQERQVGFILKSAQELTTLVNDLLDIAKVEAGKVAVRPSTFRVVDLFGALKGMLRPLLSPNAAVVLNFVDPDSALVMNSDEGKISQILRNLISNALKFTVRGEVRVSAESLPAAPDQPDQKHGIVFSVADTGVGISPENMTVIFEEFGQIETTVQQRFRGSGLGLPLSKRLAELLAGDLQVTSSLGLGSTFRLSLPLQYAGKVDGHLLGGPPEESARGYSRQVLVIDEDEVSRYLIRGLLPKHYEVNEITRVSDASVAIARLVPDIVFLNIHFSGGTGSRILRQLKQDPLIQGIPVCAYSPRGMISNLREECALADAILEISADAKTSVVAMSQVLSRLDLLVPDKDNHDGH